MDAPWTDGYPTSVLVCNVTANPSDGVSVVLVAHFLGSPPQRHWTAIQAFAPTTGIPRMMSNFSGTGADLMDATCGYGVLVVSWDNGDVATLDVRPLAVVSKTSLASGYLVMAPPAAHAIAAQQSLDGVSMGTAVEPALARPAAAPVQPVVLWSDIWGVAAFDGGAPDGPLLWNTSSSMGWAIVGSSTPIAPDGSHVAVVNYSSIVALSMADGTLAWSWPWPDNLGLGGTDVLLAWAAPSTSGPAGLLYVATNLEEQQAPWAELGFVAAIDGASGKTVATLVLDPNHVMGAGNLAVDASGQVLYTTTWVNPPGALRSTRISGQPTRRARHWRARAEQAKADPGAPIPTTLTTRFVLDATAGSLTCQSYGPPMQDGNLAQTYSLGPADGQLRVMNGTALQVLGA